MPTQKLTNEIIAAAIEGFEVQKTRINQRIAELQVMLSSGPAESATMPEAPERKRRKFSAAARKRMKEAQQRRWAKIRGESESPAPGAAKPAKAKRRISTEGLRRIIAATKRRWRLQKAAAKARSAGVKRRAGATRKAAASKAA
jgi:hypothetical protein